MSITRSIYDGPPKGYTKRRTDKKWIIIHNTSNDASAEDEASYAKRRTDSVSSHYYVDGNSIVQSLDTDYRAWHVGSSTGNAGGIGYEITGTNAKSRAWWKSNVAWGLLAAQIRRDCAEHHITPRTLSISEIRAGKTGIITHDQARRAWGGTTHTDPGPGFPLGYLVDLVRGASPSVSPSGVPEPTLCEGDEGPGVGQLQRALNEALDAGLDVDEDFGPATAAAVAELQRRAGITVDEIYGPDSARVLADLLEEADMPSLDEIKFGVWNYTNEKLTTKDAYAILRGIAAEQAAAKRRDAAILSAVEGIDAEAILDQIDRRSAEDAERDAQLLAQAEASVRAALPSVEQLAAAVAAAVDHDLDTAAVEEALRRVLGGVDEAA